MSCNTGMMAAQARLRKEFETKKATAKALLGKDDVSSADVEEAQKLTVECKNIGAELKKHSDAFKEVEELDSMESYTSSDDRSNGDKSYGSARIRGDLGSAEAMVNWAAKRAVASWELPAERYSDLASPSYMEAFGRWMTGEELSNADTKTLDIGRVGSYKGVPEYLMPISVKDLTLASSASAGLMAPSEFRNTIVERPPGLSTLYNLCTKISTSAKQVDLPRSTSTDPNFPSSIRVTQVNERPTVGGGGFPDYEHKATDPAFEQVPLAVGTRMSYIDMSDSLIEDWVGALAYVYAKLDQAFVLDREFKLMLGSGTNGAIQGLVTLLKSGETMKPTRIASGTSGDFTAANVNAMDAALEDPYDAGSVWLMRKATKVKIGGFTQANKPVFFDPAKPWSSQELLDHPIVRTGFIPLANDASNKVPLFLINPSSITIVERVGMSVRQNPWIKSGTTRIEARSRETGKMMETWFGVGLECLAA